MAKQYKALQPVGRFQKGDVVGGLSDAQIKSYWQMVSFRNCLNLKLLQPRKLQGMKSNG